MSFSNTNYPNVHVTQQEPITIDGKLVFNIAVTVDIPRDMDSVSSVSNDFVSIASDMIQDDVRVEVTQNNGVTSRTTITPLPNNTVRCHTRFEEHEAPEIEDYVTRKLRNDLKHWSIREVRPNSVLVYPYSAFSMFRGRYKTFPDTIVTGTLYHRPLHFSDQYGGYWINKDSELARLIDKNSQDINTQRIAPGSCMNKDSKILQSNTSDWQVIEETEHMFLVRNNNPNSRWFGRGVSRRARMQPLAYSQRDGGFWINKNSALAKHIHKAQAKSHVDAEGSFTDDITKNWKVVMTKQNFDNDGCVESVLIRPCKRSRYENRPSVIDTEGAYHRHIYYHSGDDGYWVGGDSYLYQCVSENGGLLRQ
jgi:hypothetical protein